MAVQERLRTLANIYQQHDIPAIVSFAIKVNQEWLFKLVLIGRHRPCVENYRIYLIAMLC